MPYGVGTYAAVPYGAGPLATVLPFQGNVAVTLDAPRVSIVNTGGGIMGNGPVYAGTTRTSTATFTNPGSSTPVDPSTISLKYKAGSHPPVTWDYGGSGSIVQVSTGVYSVELDTTALAGFWTIEWIGTGACAVVGIAQFQVITPPL